MTGLDGEYAIHVAYFAGTTGFLISGNQPAPGHIPASQVTKRAGKKFIKFNVLYKKIKKN